MKSIPLTRGLYATVSDEDYDALMKYNWCAEWMSRARTYYALRSGGHAKGEYRRMHQFVMHPPKGMQVDHVDHNGLNNTRANLRICSHAENEWNRRKHRGNSKYKGVYKDRRPLTNPFQAYIRVNGKKIHLGFFRTEEDAAIAYNEAAKRHRGQFALLNVIQEIAGT